MKKIKTLIGGLGSVILSCLTLVLIESANTSGCVYVNQPKEPTSISRFKKFNK